MTAPARRDSGDLDAAAAALEAKRARLVEMYEGAARHHTYRAGRLERIPIARRLFPIRRAAARHRRQAEEYTTTAGRWRTASLADLADLADH